MKSERSAPIAEQGYEGRSSTVRATSSLEDACFHGIGLGFTEDQQRINLDEMVQGVMRQYKDKIDELLERNEILIAAALIRHLKRFHPDYPIPNKWQSLV